MAAASCLQITGNKAAIGKDSLRRAMPELERGGIPGTGEAGTAFLGNHKFCDSTKGSYFWWPTCIPEEFSRTPGAI